MNEPRLRTRPRCSAPGERDEAGLERQAAERDEHARSQGERRLLDQVLPAIRELFRKRAIVRRSALDRRRQAGAEEIEPVARTNRLRPVREADREESAEEEVARLVACENPAGAVPAVRRRREPDDQEARARITEWRERTAPVLFSAKAARDASRRLFAPGDETRTTPARNDAVLEAPQGRFGAPQRREYFPVSRPSASTWPRIAATSSPFVAPARRSSVRSSAETVKT
jgi:hypothetical protein